MPRRPVRRLLLALTVCLSLAACGEGSEAADQTQASGTSGAEESTSRPCESVAPTAEPDPAISTDLTVAPVVPASEDAPPCGLVISDIVVGTGAEAVAGTTAQLKYVGAFYETGEEFDSSWSRGPEETLPVVVGAGQVIPGFEQAITGMNVGGRRLVTIPSELGYGPQGSGPIPPDATLTFVLDLVEVTA